MIVKIFRDNFVNRLKASINENFPRYQSDETWIDELAGASTATINTAIEPTEELKLSIPDGKDLKDVENSILVHRALSSLTPLQARDPRLWTRLAHVECWEYMRQRWDIERYGEDREKAKRFILSHYFIAQNQSRALLRHGLARLWWYGYVTHDPDRVNPYELTGVLLSYLDITQQILERSLGRIPQVTSGFLKFLLLNDKHLTGSAEEKRVRIRYLAKQLNLRGGITLLDSFTENAVIEYLEREVCRYEGNPLLLTPTV